MCLGVWSKQRNVSVLVLTQAATTCVALIIGVASKWCLLLEMVQCLLGVTAMFGIKRHWVLESPVHCFSSLCWRGSSYVFWVQRLCWSMTTTTTITTTMTNMMTITTCGAMIIGVGNRQSLLLQMDQCLLAAPAGTDYWCRQQKMYLYFAGDDPMPFGCNCHHQHCLLVSVIKNVSFLCWRLPNAFCLQLLCSRMTTKANNFRTLRISSVSFQ